MTWIVKEVRHGIVHLQDLDDGGPTITNNAERVWGEVKSQYPTHRVVYTGTDGEDFEITVDRKGMAEFRPWHGLVWDILSR
jgi:hypothetical protein